MRKIENNVSTPQGNGEKRIHYLFRCKVREFWHANMDTCRALRLLKNLKLPSRVFAQFAGKRRAAESSTWTIVTRQDDFVGGYAAHATRDSVCFRILLS